MFLAAFPDAAGLDEADLCAIATRALNTIRPANSYPKGKRAIRIGEIADGIY
jgi:hypothetical protein